MKKGLTFTYSLEGSSESSKTELLCGLMPNTISGSKAQEATVENQV